MAPGVERGRTPSCPASKRVLWMPRAGTVPGSQDSKQLASGLDAGERTHRGRTLPTPATTMHMCSHTHTHVCSHTCTHMQSHTHAHALTRAHSHAHMHMYSFSCTHTRAVSHAPMHMLSHAHTHVHTRALTAHSCSVRRAGGQALSGGQRALQGATGPQGWHEGRQTGHTACPRKRGRTPGRRRWTQPREAGREGCLGRT